MKPSQWGQFRPSFLWLNQAEIYFSVAQRKVLQPNYFSDLDELERTLLAFARHYQQIAQPLEWKFTRADLHKLLPVSISPRRSSSPRDHPTRQRTCDEDH